MKCLRPDAGFGYLIRVASRKGKVLHMANASRPGTKQNNVSPGETMARRNGSEPAKLAPLNFKVTKAFRREFKTYASQHDMKMVELLHEGFRLVKEHDSR